MTFNAPGPIVKVPRNPPLEAVVNLLFIIEQNDSNPDRDGNFATALIRDFHEGEYSSPPDIFPALSVSVESWDGHDRRSLGLDFADVRYKVTCQVTYLQSVANKEVEDADVTKNLWRIFDIIEYRNDLNGLCPKERAKPTLVQQSRSLSIPGSVGNYYTGGIIRVEVPIAAHRSFYNAGKTARDLAMASGARH